MSTFTNLLPLLEQCKAITLVMSLDGDKISVVTTPKALPGAPAGLTKQMQLVGTAAELDEGFAKAILSQTASVISIDDQIALTAQKLAAEKAKLAATKAKAKPALKNESASNVNEDSDDDNDDDDSNAISSNQTDVVTTPVVENSQVVDLF